jgi:hypothetical protein
MNWPVLTIFVVGTSSVEFVTIALGMFASFLAGALVVLSVFG